MVKLFKLYEEVDEARQYWLDVLEDREFIASDGTRLPYRLFVPDTYSETNKYPLQIHLHGAGIRGNDNKLQIYHDCKETQMMFAYQHYEPFVFAIPQCPVEYTWGAFYYDTELGTYILPRLDEAKEICITRAVYELTEYLTEKYSVDRDRRYLSGTSMGGAGVYELIYRHGEIFAGAIVGCTASDPYTVRDIASVPMYILHGTADTVISVENSRRTVKILDSVGADYVYREFEGRDHDFTATETGDAELCDAMRWVFSKKRK